MVPTTFFSSANYKNNKFHHSWHRSLLSVRQKRNNYCKPSLLPPLLTVNEYFNRKKELRGEKTKHQIEEKPQFKYLLNTNPLFSQKKLFNSIRKTWWERYEKKLCTIIRFSRKWKWIKKNRIKPHATLWCRYPLLAGFQKCTERLGSSCCLHWCVRGHRMV